MNIDVTQVKIFAINFVTVLGNIMSYAIFVRIILSWVNMGGMRKPGKFTYFIHDITEPILRLAKRLPHRIGMLDLSPFTAMLLINILVYVLAKLITLI